MGQNVDDLLFEVFAEFVGEGVGQDVEGGDVVGYFFEFLDAGNLVFTEVELEEGWEMGEGVVDGFDFVVSGREF